jgi:hypothetical protein
MGLHGAGDLLSLLYAPAFALIAVDRHRLYNDCYCMPSTQALSHTRSDIDMAVCDVIYIEVMFKVEKHWTSTHSHHDCINDV